MIGFMDAFRIKNKDINFKLYNEIYEIIEERFPYSHIPHNFLTKEWYSLDVFS